MWHRAVFPDLLGSSGRLPRTGRGQARRGHYGMSARGAPIICIRPRRYATHSCGKVKNTPIGGGTTGIHWQLPKTLSCNRHQEWAARGETQNVRSVRSPKESASLDWRAVGGADAGLPRGSGGSSEHDHRNAPICRGLPSGP